jgi:hypothetical protein
VKFRENLEFSQALLQAIDRQSESSLILSSQVLNNLCQLYRDLQDEKSALEIPKEQLILLQSFPVGVTANAAASAGDRRVQVVDNTDEKVAQEKSQWLEQLGNLATSNYKFQLGINSLVASAVWQRVTTVQLPERAIYCLYLLAKMYSISGNENLSRFFRYAALIDALSAKDYPALVIGTILNMDLDRFSDGELPFVERVLRATKSAAQGKTVAKNELPSIDMNLLEIAM